MVLSDIANIQKLTAKQFKVGDSLIVQHPFDKSFALVCSQQPVLIDFDLDAEKESNPNAVKLTVEKQDKTANLLNKSSISDFSRFTHIESYSQISDETSIGFFAIRNDGYVQIGSVSLEEDSYGLYTSISKIQLDETIESLCRHPV